MCRIPGGGRKKKTATGADQHCATRSLCWMLTFGADERTSTTPTLDTSRNRSASVRTRQTIIRLPNAPRHKGRDRSVPFVRHIEILRLPAARLQVHYIAVRPIKGRNHPFIPALKAAALPPLLLLRVDPDTTICTLGRADCARLQRDEHVIIAGINRDTVRVGIGHHIL